MTLSNIIINKDFEDGSFKIMLGMTLGSKISSCLYDPLDFLLCFLTLKPLIRERKLKAWTVFVLIHDIIVIKYSSNLFYIYYMILAFCSSRMLFL